MLARCDHRSPSYCHGLVLPSPVRPDSLPSKLWLFPLDTRREQRMCQALPLRARHVEATVIADLVSARRGERRGRQHRHPSISTTPEGWVSVETIAGRFLCRNHFRPDRRARRLFTNVFVYRGKQIDAVTLPGLRVPPGTGAQRDRLTVERSAAPDRPPLRAAPVSGVPEKKNAGSGTDARATTAPARTSEAPTPALVLDQDVRYL